MFEAETRTGPEIARKAAFSKCFTSTMKRKASVFSFSEKLRFRDGLGRTEGPGRPNRYPRDFQILIFLLKRESRESREAARKISLGTE